MQIEAKFICPEIVGEMKNGTYTVAEGSTIRDLLTTCQKENNIFIKEEYLKWLVYLADGKPAHSDTLLDGVNMVYILRAVVGG